MKQRVSRRNRRTASTQARHARDLTIFAISLVIFIGGAGGLAWAVHANPAQSDETPPQPQMSGQSEHPDSYSGVIMPVTGDDASTNSDATNEADTTAEVDGALDARQLSPDETDSRSDEVAQTSSTPLPAEPANATPDPEPQTGYVVHHTAYREQTVYRTVHHQASTAREITIAGKTRIEWTRCPVCDQRHSNAYNERVVDHVNPIFCAACGGRHDTDYDETVYY